MTMKIDQDAIWNSYEFLVLDLEGTGAQHKEREGIVEIAAIPIGNAQLLNNYFYKLINPEIAIPPIVSKIHGLKNKDVEHEPRFSEVETDLFQFINNKILIGHNVNVDYRLLKLKMPNYTPALLLDTKKLSKHFWPTEAKHNLDEIIDRFQLKEQLNNLPIKRGRHSAFYDAYATGLVFLRMIQEKFTPGTTLADISRICEIRLGNNDSQQGTLF